MRLFIAIELPAELKYRIEARVAPLRDALPAASWVKSENYHVTLAFIGEQLESVASPIETQLQSSVRERHFSAEVRGAGFFPNVRRARVAWIGLAPGEQFSELATEVREALRRAHVPFDEKPFKPHLTIARLKEPWNEHDAARLTAAFDDFSEGFDVHEVTLFASQLAGKGAIHRKLGVARLSRS